MLTLIAMDKGEPQRTSSNCNLTIYIDDVNDNSPVIDPSSLNGKILENKNASSAVMVIKATDADLGKNAELEYTIQLNDRFQIDSRNGTITTLVPLDREEKENYRYEVTVSDKGDRRRQTKAFVNIKVLDVDDNCPRFIPEVYNVSVREDLKIGTSILTIYAEDKDIKRPLYGISDGNSKDAFQINVTSGVISVFRGKYHLHLKSLFY